MLAVTTAAMVYHPILQNFFVSDDFLNLYRILNCGFWEYILTPHGGHTLVARNLVFFLCEWIFGNEPAGYFWVALLTHIANVALLFGVVRQLTGSTRLATLGATLWGTSPVHDGALGWYSVYGHVMAATALLLMLRWVLKLDGQTSDATRRTLRACYVAALIGMVSFGVGIGIALVLPFAVALLAPATSARTRARIPLLPLLIVVPAVYVSLFAINGFFFDEGIETPGVVAKYIVELWHTIVPNTMHLMAYGLARLLMTFRFDPDGISPATTPIIMGAFALLLLASAWAGATRQRRAMGACVLLAVGCYGFIAMGRLVFFQALSSSLMAIQPRYHYAGLVPLTLLICLILASIGTLRVIPSVLKSAALIIALGAIGAAYATSNFHVDHHPEARVQVDEVMTAVMSSVGAAEIGDDVYIPNRSFGGFFVLPPTVFPGWAAVFAIYFPTNVVEGRHVYFVEKRLGVLIASSKGKRSANLIVPAPEASSR